MKALFDATVLLLLIDDRALPPQRQGRTAAEARGRLSSLLETLDRDQVTVVIPTPVLAELLVHAPTSMLAAETILSTVPRVKFSGFDKRAAIECGLLLRSRWSTLRTKKKVGESLPKIKFDHQIMSIARVEGVTTVYSDDSAIQAIAGQADMTAFGVWDLPPGAEEERDRTI